MAREKKVGKISSVKPVGQQILVEMLKPDEALGTTLVVGESTEVSSPQAYIVELGPTVETTWPNWGIKKGDRVLLQGNYVPVPSFKSGRQLGLVEMHTIKCVLGEKFIEEV